MHRAGKIFHFFDHPEFLIEWNRAPFAQGLDVMLSPELTVSIRHWLKSWRAHRFEYPTIFAVRQRRLSLCYAPIVASSPAMFNAQNRCGNSRDIEPFRQSILFGKIEWFSDKNVKTGRRSIQVHKLKDDHVFFFVQYLPK